MAPPVVPAEWKPVGSTINTRYFEAGRDVLIVMPEQGLKDDGPSARANMDFQTRHALASGRRCAVVVMMSSLVSQDGDARRVYAAGMDPKVFFAAALVVTNPLARAIGSFFLGLTRPGVPTRLFESIESALAWVDTQRAMPIAS
ncbi:MAG: hypothetical protein LAO77_09830 [Acidobacteriia bacterium]|nr:hypothetical protein [Terriglobia bacterium]